MDFVTRRPTVKPAAERPRNVPCALCVHFMWSEHFGSWFCSLHCHVATEDDGCTFGEEDEGGEDG